MKRIVIVGAGHAGVELSFSLRKEGFEGQILLIDGDEALPYQRPPLSKEFLKTDGTKPLRLKTETLYRSKGIDLRLGTTVVGIDRARRAVCDSKGRWLDFDHLVLALGARNRRLEIDDVNQDSILELRDLAQSRNFLGRLGSLSHVTIIGGGFIGLEASAFLREKGIGVDIVELADRLMARSVSLPTSDYYLDLHRQLGATIHLDAQVKAVRRTAERQKIEVSNGRIITSDAVLLSAGVVPNVEIASRAGLQTANGILVNQRLTTSDQHISAIGDCALFPCSHSRGRVRLESIQNSTDQARYLARILTSKEPSAPYSSLPWFWSNQGSSRLQIAGVGTGHDRAVMRGDPNSSRFSVLLYRAGCLIAVESVNWAADHLAARNLLRQGINIPPDRAADPVHELKSFLHG